MVRCKFRCNQVKESVGWIYSQEKKTNEQKVVHEATFVVVSGGTPENEQFFSSTPSGSLMVGTHKEKVFEAGKEYYIDIHEAVIEG